MKKHILTAWVFGVGSLMAETTAADPENLNHLMGNFRSFMTFFVAAIVIISIIGAFRMFRTNKQKPKKKDVPPLQAPKGAKMSRPPKKPFISFPFLLILILLLVVMWHSFSGGKDQTIKESFSNFMQRVENGSVVEAQFSERDIYYTDKAKRNYVCTMPFDDPRLVDNLVENGVEVTTIKPPRWTGILINILPFLLLIGFWFFIMRGMKNQNKGALSFGKSRAKLQEGSKSKTTFKDVAGVDEAKEELQEIVEFLKAPSRFQRLGGKMPRGVLLVGRPGTGKTLLAKAVAGEAQVPFFTISGSDFVEMFVGVGAARVRDLFAQAKKSAPCITFIDEIDAVGRHRGTGLGGGHDEREQTLNQLLVEMDGFEPNEAVIIIAATNRPDILDPALLRPGRFDRQVTVDLPDIKGRTEILKVHAAKVPLSEDVHLEIIARGTPGFSGADLANLVNEAALIAANKNQDALTMIDFEEAKDKLTLGMEKKSRVIPEEDKKITAYHEIGHVLTSVFLEQVEPVHKVSIIPRGFTGGATHYLQSDKTGYSRSYLNQMLVTLLGGRAAEEVVFNELTTGAGNDLQRTTDIAKKMVCSWGMSDLVGPMTIGKDEGEVFLGKELVARDIYSDETAKLVDSEIRRIISEAHQQALEILTKHRSLMDEMAEALQEKETLETVEIFEMIIAGTQGEERELAMAKFDRAKEMRFEHSASDKEEKETEEKPDLLDEIFEEKPKGKTYEIVDPPEEEPAEDTPEETEDKTEE